MKTAQSKKFEVAEYRDGFGSYYLIVSEGRATCVDIKTNPSECIRTKAETRRELSQREQAS